MRTAARPSRSVLAKFFRGLGDPSRLAILLLLREGSRRVSDVVEGTGLSQPNASMHLSCLWECGLVEREPNGRSVYYRLSSDRVTPLLGMAEDLLAANGHRIECCPRYRSDRPNGERNVAPSVKGRTGTGRQRARTAR